MAKANKKPIQAINPPNSGMMAWLNQQSNQGDQPVAVGLESSPEVTPDIKVDSDPVGLTENEIGKTEPAEQLPVQEVSQPISIEPIIKGEEVKSSTAVETNNDSVPTIRKPKSKTGEGSKSGSYPVMFFKKPAKSDVDAVSEAKPVRISEEAHWLLSVLVSEARRQGHKLNVGDLIDNLLENHREVHKREVDELINQWKTRKRVG